MEIGDLKLIKGRVICYLNVRSIVANINVIRPDFENSGFMAIGLSETWLNKKLHSELYRIQGYNIVRQDRKLRKRGGGLLWYINETLEYEIAETCLNYSTCDIEALTIIVKPHKQRKFYLTLVYLPPAGKRENAFIALDHICESIDCSNSYRVVGGDFNMDYNSAKRGTNKQIF